MSFLCKIGLHNYTKVNRNIKEEKKYDKGACIETYLETYYLKRCIKCGKKKKEMQTYIDGYGDRCNERKLKNREWKDK